MESSPNIKVLLAIIENVKILAVKHNQYDMAKDVLKTITNVCSDMGIEIDPKKVQTLMSVIGIKNPIETLQYFYNFYQYVVSLDYKKKKINLLR